MEYVWNYHCGCITWVLASALENGISISCISSIGRKVELFQCRLAKSTSSKLVARVISDCRPSLAHTYEFAVDP